MTVEKKSIHIQKKIEAVSKTQTEHFVITKRSNEARQISTSKNKGAYTEFDIQHRCKGMTDNNITENIEEEEIVLHEQTIDTSCIATDSKGS